MNDPILDAFNGSSGNTTPNTQQSDPVISAFGGDQTIEQMREKASGAPQGFYQNFEGLTHQPLSNIPYDVRNAEEVTGKHDYDGYCEAFAEQMVGLPKMGATAGDAWNNFVSQGKAFQDISQAPVGSLIYFQPDGSNQYAGHVAINAGNGEMVSATYNGVREDNINDWITKTNQTPLGFVTP